MGGGGAPAGARSCRQGYPPGVAGVAGATGGAILNQNVPVPAPLCCNGTDKMPPSSTSASTLGNHAMLWPMQYTCCGARDPRLA
eukprot:1581064-Amphidinium_carterae.1